MAKTYPCLGNSTKYKTPRGLCVICKAPAYCRVDIQTNWFRGDDEVFRTCVDHSKNIDALIATLVRNKP